MPLLNIAGTGNYRTLVFLFNLINDDIYLCLQSFAGFMKCLTFLSPVFINYFILSLNTLCSPDFCFARYSYFPFHLRQCADRVCATCFWLARLAKHLIATVYYREIRQPKEDNYYSSMGLMDTAIPFEENIYGVLERTVDKQEDIYVSIVPSQEVERIVSLW